MKPLDFVKSAGILVESGRGKPSQVNLRRAMSSGYYALFHALARTCANMFVGGVNAGRGTLAWQRAYRAVDHGLAKAACLETTALQAFPQEIRDFADLFFENAKKPS
jgi:hypothetical protein